MNKNTLKKFAKIRALLLQEYAAIQARLQEVKTALGSESASQPAIPPAQPKGKRKMSAAGRAAIAAGAKARWAKVNAAKAANPAAPAKPKGKRKMSAAGRAAISAAAKARWAKVRAAKAKAAK